MLLKAGEYMSFVSIDWTTILMLGNTLILFLLMRKYFFGPVKAMLDSRAAKIDDSFKQAEEANTTANALRNQYEESLKSARSEANSIVAAAQKRANEQADDIIRAANEKSMEISKKAQAEILREKTKALNEIKDEIGSLAVELAAKVVEKDINQQDHERLITGFIQELGDR